MTTIQDDLPTEMIDVAINVANLVDDFNNEDAIRLYQVIRQLFPQIGVIVSLAGADGEALTDGVNYDSESGQLYFRAAAALPQYLLLTVWDRNNRPHRIRAWVIGVQR